MYKLALASFKDLILSIKRKNKAEQVAFDLINQFNMNDNPDGNVALVWKRLIQKYEPKTAPSYIQLKQEFSNSNMEDVSKDPEK